MRVESCAYGNSATCSSPAVSAKPSIRFMFCTAWPDAPLVEIVERRTDDGAAGRAVGGDADERHVGTPHMPGLRVFPERRARARTARPQKPWPAAHADPAA